jgi:hypothetical protein
MRHFLLISLVLISSLVFLSCEKKHSTSTGLDLTGNIWTRYQSIISMSVSEGDSWIELTVNGTEDVDLEINDLVLYPDYSDFSDNVYWGEYYITSSPGSLIHYKLTVDGLSYSGTVTAPESPTVNYPDFDAESNFDITWTTTTNPMSFFLWYNFNHALDDEIDKSVQLSGSKRNYTINKTVWSGLDTIQCFDTYIDAVNYKTNGTKCLIMVTNGDSYEWDRGKESGFSKSHFRAKIRRIVNLIQAGKIELSK